MKKKVIITTIVSFVLLFAVVIAGLNAIFTVTSVRATYTAYSKDGEEEAQELQEKLNGFKGKSLTFFDMKEIEKVVAEYPYFQLEETAKSYPETVRVTITERKEAFVFPLENGKYAVLDEEGCFLRESEDSDNRASGKNILLGGGFSYADGTLGNYASELLVFYGILRENLGEVRANVLSVVVEGDPKIEELQSFVVNMREGVSVRIYDPHASVKEKSMLAVQKYLSLGDGERVCGEITVLETRDGELTCRYNALNA